MEQCVEIHTATFVNAVQGARRHRERGVTEVTEIVVAALNGPVLVELVATKPLEAGVTFVVVHEGGAVALVEQVGGDPVFVHVGM